MDNMNTKDNKNNKYDSCDFSKVEVYDIDKARDNLKKNSHSKFYEYANKISLIVNDSIKKESEKGNSKCNVYINLKEIFGKSDISTKDYSSMIDYITGLYSLKGYDISVYSSRMITKFPIERNDIYLKVYISWI